MSIYFTLQTNHLAGPTIHYSGTFTIEEDNSDLQTVKDKIKEIAIQNIQVFYNLVDPSNITIHNISLFHFSFDVEELMQENNHEKIKELISHEGLFPEDITAIGSSRMPISTIVEHS